MECNVLSGLYQTEKGHLIYEPNFNKEEILTISPTKLSNRIVRFLPKNTHLNIMDYREKNEESDNEEIPLKKASRKYYNRNEDSRQNFETLYCTISNNEKEVVRRVNTYNDESINALMTQMQEFQLNDRFQYRKEEYLHLKETEFTKQSMKLHQEALTKLEQLHVQKQKSAKLKAARTMNIENACKESEEYNNLLEHHKIHSKLQNAKKASADLELRQQNDHKLYKSKLKEQYILLHDTVLSLVKKENFYIEFNAIKFGALSGSIKDKMFELQGIINLKLIKDSDLSMAENLYSQIYSLIKDVNFIKESDEIEHDKLKLLLITKTEEEHKTLEMKSQITVASNQENNRSLQHPFNHEKELDYQIEELIKTYFDRQNKLKEIEEICDSFAQNQQMKPYRFRLQRCIGESLNIVDENTWQKTCNKLTVLLNRHPIEMADKSSISVTSHEHAFIYAMNHIAKKIVINGGETVSAKMDSASKFSILLLELWSQFPLLGDLFLAQLQIKCPLCVPYYIPRNNMNDQDYYRALGYTIESNGSIEDETSFLKRLSGYITLYATIIITPHPRDQLPISTAWEYIACILYQPPHPKYTATILYHFLVIVDKEMMCIYKKQYIKLLRYIHIIYLPHIVQVMKDGTNSFVSRLQNFVYEAQRTDVLKIRSL